MKNKYLFITFAFISALALSFMPVYTITSCEPFDPLYPINEPTDLSGNSEIAVQFLIPNYKDLSSRELNPNVRIYAPQSKKVRLSIKTGSSFTTFDTMDIDLGDETPSTYEYNGLPINVWSGTFTDLKAGVYAANSLRIELLDSTDTPITVGYNSTAVTAVDWQSKSVMFFPVPVSPSNSGSLTHGEMKFYKIDLYADVEYKLTLTVTGHLPDIILFKTDGTIHEYYQINENENFELELYSEQFISYYAGIYAHVGDVSNYYLNLSYNIDLSDSEFIDDFNDGTLNGWETSRNNTGIPLADIVDDDAERGKVIVFNAANTTGGSTSSITKTVISPVPMALSFLIKTDLNGDFGNLVLKINDNEITSFAGLRGSWRSETVIVNAGTNKIEFVLVKKTNSQNTGDITNTIRLDNISFVEDATASVVLYPRGNLNTYVGAPDNEKIQFRAEALRKDGTIRENASGFVFSAGVNSATGLFTPSTTGKTHVTVTQDGKSATRNITVHPANYLRLPYTYPGTGVTYNGYAGTEGSLTTNGGVTVTYPSAAVFNADGFFTLEGTVNNSAVYNYAYVKVVKTGTSLETYYLVRDNFKQRIWLRFGPGSYTVTVAGLSSITLSPQLGADGDFTGGSFYGNPVTFTVTNTRNDGTSVDGETPDRRFIYPSYLVQSDDFRITNLASDLTYGLTDNAAKIKAIHDYIIANTVYDRVSFNNPNARRKQDALTVMGTRHNNDAQYPGGHFLAVCEGYSNLFAALLRASGFEVRYVSGSGHGWNHVYVNGGWKLFDVTWDDPVPGGSEIGDMGPYYISYKYFMLNDLSGVSGDHYGYEIASGRFVNNTPVQQGAPDGWY